MRQGFVKVAAVTPKIKVADPKYNAEVICGKLDEALGQGAKVIVFPELCVTGYTCGDLFLQQILLDDAKAALNKIVQATVGKDALVLVGLPVEYCGRLYNVAAVLQNGRILGMVPKSNIPSYAEFYEGRHFTEGSNQNTMMKWGQEESAFGTRLLFTCNQLPELALGVEICEDLWVANPPSTGHALMGATVIANLSASNETVSKNEYRQMLVQSSSARLICGYIYASAGEGESTQDLVFGGHNMIAENGTILAESKQFVGETVYADVDVKRLMTERRRMGTFGKPGELEYKTIGFDLNVEETKLKRKFNAMPFVPSDEYKRNKRCEEILSIQAYGLKKRYEHTGCKTAVIGVSGGLDSTLALLVTVKTFDMLSLDRKGIYAVTMPCFGTT
ncbi:MAG: NAD(+) synthase, partial [Acetatifactor sp.]|nr:NAD(+) synthase [Acetatifactor sp.]